MAKYLVPVSIESLVEWMEKHQPEAAGLFLDAFSDGMGGIMNAEEYEQKTEDKPEDHSFVVDHLQAALNKKVLGDLEDSLGVDAWKNLLQ